MRHRTISMDDLLRMVYNTAECYINGAELNEEQRFRIGNIVYSWCKCDLCAEHDKPTPSTPFGTDIAGHADPEHNKIFLSYYRFISDFDSDSVYGDRTLLLELINTALHEIVHILYPEFDEKQTRSKTLEWIKRNIWLESNRIPSLPPRARTNTF